MCDQCPAGYYCEANTTDPYANPCPPGHYCPPGTSYAEEYPCWPGTYNNYSLAQNETGCLLCPPGQYCEGYGRSQPNGNCTQGWYCAIGAYQAQPLNSGK